MTDPVPVVADAKVADLSSNELELRYADQCDLAYRKKHGQFFTPYSIARFMAQWITESSAVEPGLLDPCAGLGVFERAICETRPEFARNAHFALWEKDQGLAGDLATVCDRLAIDHSVTCKDFLDEHAWSASYDAIIANPPYYKHHFVRNKEDIREVMSARIGAAFSVQTNIYCWFLIKALALLKTGGRLAFIIPTEFLNANYGCEVKKHLIDTGCLRHIISVCYKSQTFDDAITTACVLLAEKVIRSPASVRFYRADSADRLGDPDAYLTENEFIEFQSSELDADRKWRTYFPGRQWIRTDVSKLVPFSTYGRFSRGIATGANAFFALRRSTAADRELPARSLIPCLSKARQAPQKVFTQRDFEALKLADQPVLLFDGQAGAGRAVERYIAAGEASGCDKRYLTKVRSPWYALEKRRPARIWVCVFGRAGVRFVWNESGCITLTCFHVFQPSEVGKTYLPFLFLYLNSATGRILLEPEKREYGDGLEKYEPNDINKSLAPDFSMLSQRDIERLRDLQKAFIKSGIGAASETAILAEADAIFGTIRSRE